jgi:nucleoside-diphosphate-sugar epimerase
LGAHFIRALNDRVPAERIRAFDMHPPQGALPQGVEFMAGSVGDPAALAHAAVGARATVHLAAKVQPESRDDDDMYRVNVVGTQNVCLASIDSGCRLFLHVSSAGVYGPPRRAEPFGRTTRSCRRRPANRPSKQPRNTSCRSTRDRRQSTSRGQRASMGPEATWSFHCIES